MTHKFAIIGTREPSQKQLERVVNLLEWMKGQYGQVELMTGCSTGTEEFAMQVARSMGLPRVGVVPFGKFNRHVQKHCSSIKCMEELTEIELAVARESVRKYHQSGQFLGPDILALKARILLIVRDVERVIAFPSCRQYGGNSGYGMRVARGVGVPVWCIDTRGKRVPLERFIDERGEITYRHQQFCANY